jgi:RsiW-degrading membrane proteinase PrsW (M82 family)
MSIGAHERLLVGSPLRRPRVARRVTVALLLLLAIGATMMLVAVGGLGREAIRIFLIGLGLAALASLVPVAILWFLDRRERESPWLFVAAIVWGAVIATGLALPLNQSILGGVARWLADNPAIKDFLGPRAALLIGAPIAGPLVEEVTKGLGVLLLFWLLRAEFDTMRDGFIYGALVGVGFNLAEAPLYVAQGYSEYGVAPWGLQFGARFSLFGLGGHAMFTGIFGACLGLARQTGRRWLRVVVPIVGLLLAILAHALNNSLGLIVTILLRAAGQPLPDQGPPPQVGFLEAWIQSSLMNLVVFLPFLILVAVILRRSGVWERRVIRAELADEVGQAVTAEEYEQVKRDGIFRTRRVRGRNRRRVAALVNAQHELAFRKWRVRQDGGDPETDPLVIGWRGEVAELRGLA